MQDTENCIPLSKNENSCTEFTWRFLQVMCYWFIASVQKDELAVRKVYFLYAAVPSSSRQRDISVENFTLPVGSKLAYVVTLRDVAHTAVVLFSSWAAEMGFGKWLKNSDWVLCFQIAEGRALGFVNASRLTACLFTFNMSLCSHQMVVWADAGTAQYSVMMSPFSGHST